MDELVSDEHHFISLEYDEREKNDSKVTLHKEQALLKDGLAIPNIKIRKVSRKNGNERYNGVVVVQLQFYASLN
jgi:hypothetical protein